MFEAKLDWLKLPREGPYLSGRWKVYPFRALIEAVRLACREGGFVCEKQLAWHSKLGHDALAVTLVSEPGVMSRPDVRLAVAFRADRKKRCGVRWYHCLAHAEGGVVVLRAQAGNNRQTCQWEPGTWAERCVDVLYLKREEYLAELDSLRAFALPVARWREVLAGRTKSALVNRVSQPTLLGWTMAGNLLADYERTAGKTAWDALLSASRTAARLSYVPSVYRIDQFLGLYEETKRLMARERK